MAQTITELQISTAVFMDFNLSPNPEAGFASLSLKCKTQS